MSKIKFEKNVVEKKVDKLSWVKSSEDWNIYVEELSTRIDFKRLKHNDKRQSVDQTFQVLGMVYKDHFDIDAGGKEMGAAAFVFGLVYEDCLSLDRMTDALNKLAVRKDGIRIPVYEYSMYDLAFMSIIKNTFTRIELRF